MVPLVTFVFRNGSDSLGYDLIFLILMSAASVGYVLWDRRYRRRWWQFRAHHWTVLTGRFDEGELVRMEKAASHTFTGYQVWLTYDYKADTDRTGLYTLPFSGVFHTNEEADEYRRIVAGQNIPVHVSPRNPKHSCILDRDIQQVIAAKCGGVRCAKA